MRENKNSREESGAQDMCGCGHCHGQTEKAEKERKIGHGHEDADRDGDGCACGHCHESGEHGENKKATAVLCVSAALLAIAILATKVFFTDLPQWAVLLIFLVPYLVSGFDILKESVENIFHGKIFDENFLMSVATIGALILGDYAEAVFVMIFFKIGELFENIAVGKSKKSIEKLMDIRPDTARVIRSGKEEVVSPEDVEVGETITVYPGEKIPLDGVVTEGTSSLDTVALTGESMPRSADAGDEVKSGFVNIGGVLKIRVDKPFGQSAAAKILEIVNSSSSKKAHAEKFISRCARVYTPTVVIGALLLAVIPPLFLGITDSGVWGEWVSRALTFLVISCPCALVISVPLSFFGGIGGASKAGILIKNSQTVEAIAKIKTVVFDKTGTLTKGSFMVSAIHPTNISEEELLEYATLAECFSAHPISVSLRAAYGKTPDTARITQVREIPGHGVTVLVDGKEVCVGNDRLMDSRGAEWKNCHLNGTIVHVTVDGQYVGHIVIADTVKENSSLAVHMLKEEGVRKTVMLTGDRKDVAAQVGEAIGIDEIEAELLPEQKVEKTEKLLEVEENRMLAFVGDGINDAPVLTRADVGIAMGGIGSDAAVEAADAVIMDDNPSKTATAIKICKKTLLIVRENIVFAIAVKIAVLLLGAFGFAPIWLAIFADVGVMVIAVANALRTLRVKSR
ncbi:MAG: heavy metal translocating P-type ATPase [Eubacteriales bacterium]|nr:heavy metal translocating P-type ATPase [Eubacteriales bacterium]